MGFINRPSLSKMSARRHCRRRVEEKEKKQKTKLRSFCVRRKHWVVPGSQSSNQVRLPQRQRGSVNPPTVAVWRCTADWELMSSHDSHTLWYLIWIIIIWLIKINQSLPISKSMFDLVLALKLFGKEYVGDSSSRKDFQDFPRLLKVSVMTKVSAHEAAN